MLDGVVFSGGEPTLHPYLMDALEQVRAFGFGTALHTSGAFPESIEVILKRKLVDWVGFDVKAPFDEYERVTQVAGSGERARESLECLLLSEVPYEIRTTVYPPVLNSERIEALAAEVKELGAGNLVLQQCYDVNTGSLSSGVDLRDMATRLYPLVGDVLVRDNRLTV